jgi:hypothetical protein
VGKHWDHEYRIFIVAEGILAHNPKMPLPEIVAKATQFVNLRQRRYDSAEHKDWEDKINEEIRDEKKRN